MNLLDTLVARSLPLLPRSLVRFFSKTYIAGTTPDDAFRVVRTLNQEGAMTTLDILGEFISTAAEAEANTQAYASLIERIPNEDVRETNVSVKLTALGLLLDRQLCLDNMRRLVGLARSIDNFVRIDMEDSGCTDATLEIFEVLREEFPGRVGAVLQSRLRRTLADVDRLTGGGRPTNLRLCKGIYLEPAEIAYTEPQAIRDNFEHALERMFERGCYVGIATHDAQLVEASLGLIGRYGLRRDQYEFQMLLGVTERLRRRILADGHRLRVYVPFGERWYAYSVRRLQENPQIAGYAFKALFSR